MTKYKFNLIWISCYMGPKTQVFFNIAEKYNFFGGRTKEYKLEL